MRVPAIFAAAVLVAAGSSGCTNSTTSPNSSPTTYSGPFSGQLIITTTTASSVCVSTSAESGTVKITLDPPKSDGTVTGTGETAGTMIETAATVSATCQAQPGTLSLGRIGPVTGTTGLLGFSVTNGSTGGSPTGGSVTCTETMAFTGALSGAVVSGTLTHSRICLGVGSGGSAVNGNGSTTMAVTLR